MLVKNEQDSHPIVDSKFPGLRVLVVAPINNLYRAFPLDHLSVSLVRALRETGVYALLAGYHSLGVPDMTRIYDSPLLRYISLASATVKSTLLGELKRLRLEKLVKRFSPDFIITCFIEHELARIAKTHNCKLVFWQIDYWKKAHENYIDFARKCDLVLVSARRLAPLLTETGSKRVLFVPPAVDPAYFFPLSSQAKYRFVFVGSYYPERERQCKLILYPLIRRFGRQVHLFGRKWSGHPAAKLASYHGFVEWRQIPRIYSQAEVVLGINDDYYTQLGGVNTRLFEALACRTFHVSGPNIQIEELVTPQREFVQIEYEEDVVKQLEGFLQDSAIRQSIAQQGYARFVAEHTVQNRARTVSQLLSKLS